MMAVSWLNLASGERSAFPWFQRKEGTEGLFSSGSQSFPLRLRGPCCQLWALEGAAMVAGAFPSAGEKPLFKAVGEILQEKVAIVEM